ncbi:MAG: hypothetical protein JXJ04_06515 [Spirochaetales bacterium]|nr:hypothetical protein [Spirochaetales bacterium]
MEIKFLNIIKIMIFGILFLGMSSALYADFLDDIEITPGIRFWGADVGVNYKGISFLPDLTTRLCVWFGAGYETPGYFRDADGIQYNPDDPAEAINLALYKRTEIIAAFGIRQGIFPDSAKKDNLLETYLFCRALYDTNTWENSVPGSLIFTTDYPDAYGIFLTTIITGLYLDTEIIHKTHRKRNGMTADISFEFAPSLLNHTYCAADYTRVTVDIRGYLTLIDLDPDDDEEENLFNLYICDRLLWDGLVGTYIPVAARQRVGGRKLKSESGLGGIMRGIDSKRFDGYLKMVNNFDIRCDLPSLWIFVPGVVAYFDVGMADELNYFLEPEYLHYSTGLGMFIYSQGFDLIGYANYWIDGEKVSFSFDFSLHF